MASATFVHGLSNTPTYCAKHPLLINGRFQINQPSTFVRTNRRNLPHDICTVAKTRLSAMLAEAVALRTIGHLHQMLATLGLQIVRIDLLGADQNVGSTLQRRHEHVSGTQTLLQIFAQCFWNAAKRLKVIVRVLQAIFVVVMKVTGSGRIGARMYCPVIGDRKQLREKMIHMLFEIAVVMGGDVSEQVNKTPLE